MGLNNTHLDAAKTSPFVTTHRFLIVMLQSSKLGTSASMTSLGLTDQDIPSAELRSITEKRAGVRGVVMKGIMIMQIMLQNG